MAWAGLRFVALFKPKIRLFVAGRKKTWRQLNELLSENDRTLWMHAASLGEYEQGLPVIERLKTAFPSHKIVVTFFSPSGYEVKKNSTVADVIVYLPMDTKANVSRFLDMVRPELAIFVKYEVWPNYLRELHRRDIPALLISALFKKHQVYFKPYGGFMRSALKKFSHIFVQNKDSQELLVKAGINRVTVSGDTRLDRVSEILERDQRLDFMDAFKKDRQCFVAGSTWPEDEAILIDYINHAPLSSLKYVFAPHTITPERVLGLAGSLNKKTVLYSKMDPETIGNYEVLLIDTIGLLTKIYSYADIAYVGGGFATGLHNTMEPAVFGIPVIIGPQYKGFKEAEELVAEKGILSVTDGWGFGELMKRLLDNPDFQKKTGAINARYIAKNKGASIQIVAHIRTLL